MLYKIEGDKVLKVFIAPTESSKEKTTELIEDLISYVSNGVFDAVVLINKNGDTLQFFGKDNFFATEYIKYKHSLVFDVYTLRMKIREELKGKLYFEAFDNLQTEDYKNLIPANELYFLIHHFVNLYSTERFLKDVLDKYSIVNVVKTFDEVIETASEYNNKEYDNLSSISKKSFFNKLN